MDRIAQVSRTLRCPFRVSMRGCARTGLRPSPRRFIFCIEVSSTAVVGGSDFEVETFSLRTRLVADRMQESSQQAGDQKIGFRRLW